MDNDSKLSRRTLVAGLAFAPLPATSTAAIECADAELLKLGRRQASAQAALDCASGHDEAMALLQELEDLGIKIVETPARTLEGLYVKARATAWAIEHDVGLLEPAKESSINARVCASIVRDLLQLGAPVSWPEG